MAHVRCGRDPVIRAYRLYPRVSRPADHVFTQRAAWYPYFDDVNAIIFLAPISCFDEKLVEDRRVNRLEDSYLLWQAVCACKWLAHMQMILFLNKCDILDLKLRRGVRIRDSVPSFGDRKNDLPTATKCLFRSIPFRFFPYCLMIAFSRLSAALQGDTTETLPRATPLLLPPY